MAQAVKALCRAARQGDLPAVEHILKNSPEAIDGRNRDGRTALIIAVRHSHVHIVEYLIKEGAKVNAASVRSGATPVWHASWKGHAQILEILLDHGGDATIEATECGTPLMVASQYGHGDCIRILLDHGAPVDQTQTHFQCTALWWSCRSAHYSHKYEIIRLLLAGGADYCLLDWKGRTAFDVAKFRGHQDCVEALENFNRAQFLYKMRIFHDVQDLHNIPRSRTRRGTLRSQAVLLPTCLRGRVETGLNPQSLPEVEWKKENARRQQGDEEEDDEQEEEEEEEEEEEGGQSESEDMDDDHCDDASTATSQTVSSATSSASKRKACTEKSSVQKARKRKRSSGKGEEDCGNKGERLKVEEAMMSNNNKYTMKDEDEFQTVVTSFALEDLPDHLFVELISFIY